jgi:hypothetical protein
VNSPAWKDHEKDWWKRNKGESKMEGSGEEEDCQKRNKEKNMEEM